MPAPRWTPPSATPCSTVWKPTAIICARFLPSPHSPAATLTRCLEGLSYKANTFEVISAGTQTTVQDFPGRLGYWAVGVPPSGPMDSRALRLGNALLGNPRTLPGWKSP